MKSRMFKAVLAVVMLSVVYGLIAIGTQNEMLAGSVTVSMGLFSALMYKSPMLSAGLMREVILIPDFTEKSKEEKDALKFEELEAYLAEKQRFDSATQKKDISDMIVKAIAESADSKTLELLQKQMNSLIEENDHTLLALKKATESAPKEVAVGVVDQLKKYKDELKELTKSGKGTVKFDIAMKASQGPTDIGDRVAYAQFLEGTDKIPHKRTYIKDRIRVVPTNKEYIKYRDQATVVRDAKNVAMCGVSTHNTKLTWATKTLQTTKVRDMVDICIDMLEDYDFVDGEIRELLTSSLQLKIDNDFLLADGINPNTTSIDFYSSTFNAANPAAVYTSSVQAATIIDLIVVAAAQVMAFGEQNSFMADTVYVNPKDYTLMKLTKDGDDNYIKSGTVDPRIFQDRSGSIWIDGNVLVIPNPNVPENEFYIFDSTKAAIYQRRNASIEFSYENNDNFEQEIVTVKAYERLNMLVKTNQQNAFMHVSDISTALTAITI